MIPPSRVRLASGLVLTTLLFACGDGAVEPSLPTLELVVAGGDGQFGTPGQRLDLPLQVLVRRSDTGVPYVGAAVTWTVESGDATLVTSSVGTSDSQGLVGVTVELGATPGTVTVRAQAVEQEGAAARFEAFVVDRPQLLALEPLAARGGDTITIRGAGFSPNAGQNVVLFSGIRGAVASATTSQLQVEVPVCLPDRTVDLTVQLGSLVSSPMALSVTDAGAMGNWLVGDPLDVDDPAAGGACLRLPGGRRYLVTVQSAGTVGAARYGYALSGLAAGSGAPAPSPAVRVPLRPRPPGTEDSPPWQRSVGRDFEGRLRTLEDALARGGEGTRVSRRPLQQAANAVPAVGDERSFKVLNAQSRFDDVTAVVRLVSGHAVLYVDKTAPSGGFSDKELAAFAATFDDVIHPTVTGAFGVTSDLDGNERVVILFTPTVNRLTPAGSDGFVGGFFFGLDLEDREDSNQGEIFYALVPDAAGQFSDPRSRELVLRVTPAILAHEFQHMVHYNERVLKLGADGTEALWLSEGLAQMAEELVARELLRRRDFGAVEEYRAGNRTRARRYLGDPASVSLIVATGQGSLAERGAGWLYTLYLWDRGGGDQVLADLTQSTLKGTANVEAVTGQPWRDVLADWAAALYTGGTLSGKYPFDYPQVVLRDLLRTQSPYPLSAETLGGQDFTRTGSLWSSSVRHYIVVPPTSGFVALRLGGEAGGNVPVDAAFRLRVVPLF